MNQKVTTLESLQTRTSSDMDRLMQAPSKFDPDIWHAMQSRDESLIRDSVLRGYTGQEYVYSFPMQGKTVTGISVVGARALAAQYGGIKARIIGSTDKTGELFVFKSFDPLSVDARTIPQLAEQSDFYEVIMEITDLKTGNSIQVRKKESKIERKRDGTPYERPHYDVIAESKAFRNGVLSVLPQSVISEFERKALNAGHGTRERTIDELRDAVIQFASKNSLKYSRQAIQRLTYSEVSGLGQALTEGLDQFKSAALSAGVLAEDNRNEEGKQPEEGQKPNASKTKAEAPELNLE